MQRTLLRSFDFWLLVAWAVVMPLAVIGFYHYIGWDLQLLSEYYVYNDIRA